MGTAKKRGRMSARPQAGGPGRVAKKLLAAKGGGGAAVNAFDAVGNRKAKFEVLNKRAKGQIRNVSKARQLAVERRRKTLLVEYHASKKDNVFKDRRFGEDDPSLSLEEKMLMRFQKERQKRARKAGAGRFNLEHDDNEDDDDEYGGLLLTHKGRRLGEDDYQDRDLGSSDEEDGAAGLGREIVKELHFGGGAGAAGRKRARSLDGAEGGGDGEGKKTRAELMEEIIAKSKLHKAIKAKQKDAQETALNRLDDQFRDLVGDLQFRDKHAPQPTKEAAGAAAAAAAKATATAPARKPLLDEDEDYDSLMAAVREERFAAKARDRTKTPEEIAKEEKERLEKLEAARLARMRGEVDAELAKEARGDEGEGEGKGEEDDDDEGSSSSDGDSLGGLGQGWEQDSSSSSEDSEDSEDEGEDEGEDDDDDASGSGSDEDHDEESSSGSGSASERESDSEAEGQAGKTKRGKEEAEEDAAGRPVGRVAREQAAVQAILSRAPAEGINPAMPYVLECPSTLERFGEMVKEYARGPQDVAEMISRIRRYHALRSGGKREQVHNFYDVLMRRLRKLGDHVARAGAGGGTAAARQVEIDAVADALRLMTAEMPNVAAALWGRMLTGLQARLEKALRDHELGQKKSAWPSLGALLLLRLLPLIFPATDFRHPVVTPALLLIGQSLTQCPVTDPVDVERGLFLAALALEYTERAQRMMPEALAFLLSVLWALGGCQEGRPLPLPTFGQGMGSVLRKALLVPEEEPSAPSLDPLVLAGAGGKASGQDDEEEGDDDHQDDEDQDAMATAAPCAAAKPHQYLAAVCRLLRRAAEGPLRESAAAPELLQPFADALELLAAQLTGTPALSSSGALARETREAVVQVVAAARGARAPLAWRKKGLGAVASLAPRIIDNFVVRKDEGMDREAAKVKQLARQVKREKKGAMRELRRDAAFLDAEKVRVEREKEAERKRVVRENTAWLQQEQATINQQVKKSKGEVLRGGGSGVKKVLR